MTVTPTRVEYREPLPHRGEAVPRDVNGNALPEVTIETITPAEAAEYLARNDNIRKLRPSVVDRYASDMADAHWHVGTSVIGFDENGNLRCGQHRLTACVEADAPFTTIVSRGLTQEAIDNDDQGLKRSTADVLRAKGEIATQALAAVIASSWRWDIGQVLGTTPMTQSQTAEYLAENPGIRDATSASQNLSPGPLGARISAVGPFIYRIRQIDPDRAEQFIRSLHTGADLPENDPVLRLRQYYLAKRSSQYGRPSRTHELALLVKAWNASIAGRPVKALRWGRGTSGQEEFPLLNGPNGRPWPFPEVRAALTRKLAEARDLAEQEDE
jgi:hypothetical protein